MKRVLILSDTASTQILNNRSNLRLLLELGCEIHLGCNFSYGNSLSPARIAAFQQELEEVGIIPHQINFIADAAAFTRSEAVYEEIDVLLDTFPFDLVHCMSPTALACLPSLKKRHQVVLFHTSFGFPIHAAMSPVKQFFQMRNMKKQSKAVDVLITINTEDFRFAQKNLHAKHTYHIPGVGLEPYLYRAATVSRLQMRESMEIPQNAVALITIGALTTEKNHAVILRAMAQLRMLELHYVICGNGPRQQALFQLTERLHLESRVHFVKYRDDSANLLHACDIFCLPSRQEGLGMAALEAMEAGLPLVTSNIQGIQDYMIDGETGFMFEPNDVNGFVAGIEALTEDRRLREHIGAFNRQIVKPFYTERIERFMRRLYQIQLDLPVDPEEEPPVEAAAPEAQLPNSDPYDDNQNDVYDDQDFDDEDFYEDEDEENFYGDNEPR